MSDPKDDDLKNDPMFADEDNVIEDESRALVRKMLEEQGFGKDDPDEDLSGGFDAPLDEPGQAEEKVVSQNEAAQLAMDAAEKAADGEDTAEKTDDDTTDDTADKAGDKPEGLRAATVDDLVKGLPDEQATELRRRLDEGSVLSGKFSGYEKDLEQFGGDAASAAERLLYLQRYARENPVEYAAWFAQQVGQSPTELFSKAAEKLGLELGTAKGKDDEDDDLFADPGDDKTDRERELEKQLEAERKKNAGGEPEFGPDAPAAQNALAIERLRTEKDATGNLVRPHFQRLMQPIAEMARAHVAEKHTPATAKDIAAFYDKAVEEARSAFGGNSAAQRPEDVEQQKAKDAAERAEKARRASKALDGTGQGASRRPALDPNADLRTVITHNLQAQLNR